MRSKTKNLSKLPFMHLLCGTDPDRPVMEHVLIENGWAIASDAHVLCAINLKVHSSLEHSEIDFMNGKMIHRNAWKLFCEKSVIIHPNEETIEVLFENGIDSVFEYSNEEGTYPKWQNVLTDEKLYLEPVKKIGITSTIYNKAASFFKKTFGSDKIDLHFSSETSHILLSNGENEVHFLIMPCLVSSELTKGQIKADFN